MSICTGCPHKQGENNKCTFTGACVVKTYNLFQDTSSAFRASAVVVPANVVAPVAAAKTAFNQFQRGNGCILAEEVNSHVR